MTPEQMAALAAGKSMEEVLAMVPANPAASAAAAAGAGGSAQKPGEGGPSGAAAPPTIEQLQAAVTALVTARTDIEASLTAVTGERDTARTELATAQTAQTELKATADAMREAVASMATTFQIALGKKAPTTEAIAAMSNADLVALFKEGKEGMAKFPVGRQAASTQTPEAIASQQDKDFVMLSQAKNFKL